MHAVVLATSTESAASLHRQAFELSEAYEGLHVQVGEGGRRGGGGCRVQGAAAVSLSMPRLSGWCLIVSGWCLTPHPPLHSWCMAAPP